MLLWQLVTTVSSSSNFNVMAFFILYPELQDERGTELRGQVAKILANLTMLL